MAFTCTKSGKSYFHKTARPEDRIHCPFQIVYKQHRRDPNVCLEADYDDGFFFLQRYKSYHNHELDLALSLSNIWQDVPNTVKAGKP
jgi:hypothetical protein